MLNSFLCFFLQRFLGISSSLKVTTSLKMIEVFMLVSLVLCFNDVLMQCYLHYHNALPVAPAEEEEDDDKAKSSAANQLLARLLSLTGQKGRIRDSTADDGNSSKAADWRKQEKEAIFDLAMRPETDKDDKKEKEAIFDLAMRPETVLALDSDDTKAVR